MVVGLEGTFRAGLRASSGTCASAGTASAAQTSYAPPVRAAAETSRSALPCPNSDSSTNELSGPRRARLPSRSRRSLSAWLSLRLPAASLGVGVVRESTAGTADRCARILAEVSARGENFVWRRRTATCV
jgi:hypothetical protein